MTFMWHQSYHYTQIIDLDLDLDLHLHYATFLVAYIPNSFHARWCMSLSLNLKACGSWGAPTDTSMKLSG